MSKSENEDASRLHQLDAALRTDTETARQYASAKWRAVSDGADMLLAYSEAKRAVIETIAARARGM
ncbi:MAG: hypothetical protein JWR80_1147 [Bradyrhizobium sp.]|nr:hypothetical protein [Bradyrhizobium sp.]